jgi:hypothetical protein
MTLDQEDLDAIVAAVRALIGLESEEGVVTDLGDQSTTAVSVTGLIGAEGDYLTMQVQFRTGATRKRTIIEHKVTIGTDGFTRVDVLTFNAPLGAPPTAGAAAPDRLVLC